MNKKVRSAICTVLALHAGQYKRDGTTPTVAHLFGVALKVSRHTKKESVIIAALLHDSLESSALTADEIEKNFNKETRALVEHLTESSKSQNTNATWLERKEEYLNKLKEAPRDALLISCAEKTDILEIMIPWHKKSGDQIWQHFHSPEDKHLWLYEKLGIIYRAHLGGLATREYMKRLRTMQSLVNHNKK